MFCNATLLGMTQGDPLPVVAELLAPSMFVGDVIAEQEKHYFWRLSAADCKTANSDQMVEAA